MTDTTAVYRVAAALAEHAWKQELARSYDPTMWKKWHELSPEYRRLEQARFLDRAVIAVTAMEQPDITDEWRAGLLTLKCQVCNEDDHPTTHDGVRVDKAIKPRSGK